MERQRAGIILLRKYAEAVAEMSVEDAGMLLKAVYAYDTGAEIQEMTPFARALFLLISADMRDHADRYAKRCEQNRSNAHKRWEKETTSDPARPCERMQLNTAVYDAVQPQPDACESCQEEEEENGRGRYMHMPLDRPDASAPMTSAQAGNVYTLMTGSERERFEKFWAIYPRRESRARAESVWKELCPDETLTARILLAVKKACASDPRFQTLQYTPHPANWLRRREWENEYTVQRTENADYGSWTTD